jgi:hypothetical protein
MVDFVRPQNRFIFAVRSLRCSYKQKPARIRECNSTTVEEPTGIPFLGAQYFNKWSAQSIVHDDFAPFDNENNYISNNG